MADHDDRTAGSDRIAMLFADISGSTAIYEEHGDAKARDATAACVEVMTEVVEKFKGRVVKTIGDEVMAIFHDASNCVMASTDIQGAVRRAGSNGRFVTGALRIKVGIHFSAGLEEATDVFGEAPTVARQIINLAKADQTLASAAILEAVPAMFRVGTRRFDRIVAEGTGRPIEVYELIWEVSDSTKVADTQPLTPRQVYTILELDYRGEVHRLSEDRPRVELGRVAGNDIVVPADLTSRQHASIEYTRGRFQLTDNSANGTLVLNDEGPDHSLRRESMNLRGSGSICLGGTPETNPQGILKFSCA